MKPETAIAISQHIKQSNDVLGKMLVTVEKMVNGRKEAADLAPRVADLLIATKVASASQRDKIITKLAGSHAEALDVLGRAAQRMGAMNKEAADKLAAHEAADLGDADGSISPSGQFKISDNRFTDDLRQPKGTKLASDERVDRFIEEYGGALLAENR